MSTRPDENIGRLKREPFAESRCSCGLCSVFRLGEIDAPAQKRCRLFSSILPYASSIIGLFTTDRHVRQKVGLGKFTTPIFETCS